MELLLVFVVQPTVTSAQRVTACATAWSVTWLMDTLISLIPNVAATALACPCSETAGAPEGVRKISMSLRGAALPSQRLRASGLFEEMALMTASLAAHRPAKLAAVWGDC